MAQLCRLYFIFCLFILSLRVFAATYVFENFDGSDFLAANTVNSIVEGPGSYIWLGTEQGLHRFDRIQSTIYQHDPANNRSLSSNFINDLEFDHNGMLWVATQKGLNRFDPAINEVTHVFSQDIHPALFPDNFVKQIRIDSKGDVWAATKGGVVKVDGSSLSIQPDAIPQGLQQGLNQNQALALHLWSDDTLFIGYRDAGLVRLELTTGQWKVWDDGIALQSNNVSGINSASGLNNNELDDNYSEGKLWLGYWEGGITLFDPVHNTAEHLLDNSLQNNKLSNAEIAATEIVAIQTLADGNTWFSTSGVGILIYDPVRQELFNVAASLQDEYALKDNVVRDVYQDSSHNVWIATFNHGAYFLNHLFLNTGNYRVNETQWSNLSANNVWGVLLDSQQRLWIGTNEQLHILDEEQQSNQTPFDFDTVFHITERASGEFWLGTRGAVHRVTDSLTQLDSFFTEPDSPYNGVTVLRLFEDNKQRLWIATFDMGLVLFDDGDKSFRRFPLEDPVAGSKEYQVTAITQDEQGILWLGTNKGLAQLDEETGVVKLNDVYTASIWTLNYEAGTNLLWIGTFDAGLIQYNLGNNEVLEISSEDGLLGNSVLCAVMTKNALWVGTNAGLNRINKDNSIDSFQGRHGLQNGYNYNACATTANDQLYFGSSGGLSYFNGARLVKDSNPPKVNISQLRIYDKENNRYQTRMLSQSDLLLEYQQNELNFDFNGIYYIAPDALRFEYRLSGYNDNWITVEGPSGNVRTRSGQLRSARYANLAAGDYEFQVRVTSPDGVVSPVASRKFTIKAPWWQTRYARLFAVVLLALAIYIIVQLRTRQLEKQTKVLEHKVALRTKELTRQTEIATRLAKDKNRLFANISHEFRTPLTIIIANAEDVVDQTARNVNTTMAGIKNNASRLLSIVEQFLDFADEDKSIIPVKRQWNVKKVVNQVAAAFHALFERYGMEFSLQADDGIFVEFEDDGLEKVLINLLSNALKFADPNTQVHCQIAIEDRDRQGNDIKGKHIQSNHIQGKHITIAISDTGPGINKDEQNQIFERFYRTGNSSKLSQAGSGIGLAYVYEIVTRNGGELSLDPEYTQGCRFVIRLPMVTARPDHAVQESTARLPKQARDDIAQLETAMTNVEPQTVETIETGEQGEEQPTILIIEDNKELERLIANTFDTHYQCVSAFSGEEGIETAKRVIPDLIICDVMLGGIDGFEVLQQIKANSVTCHIPVVMLTALADLKHRVQGWKGLADDYMTKPFDREELRQRVASLLANRRILRERFAESLFALPASGAAKQKVAHDGLSERDKAFLDKFQQYIKDNSQRDSLSRADAAESLAMSERQLNRKLAAITNYNFAEYLRRYRLIQSLESLGKGKQVAEIAEDTGFANLTYFSSCFKTEFGASYKQYESLVAEGAISKGQSVQ